MEQQIEPSQLEEQNTQAETADFVDLVAARLQYELDNDLRMSSIPTDASRTTVESQHSESVAPPTPENVAEQLMPKKSQADVPVPASDRDQTASERDVPEQTFPSQVLDETIAAILALDDVQGEQAVEESSDHVVPGMHEAIMLEQSESNTEPTKPVDMFKAIVIAEIVKYKEPFLETILESMDALEEQEAIEFEVTLLRINQLQLQLNAAPSDVIESFEQEMLTEELEALYTTLGDMLKLKITPEIRESLELLITQVNQVQPSRLQLELIRKLGTHEHFLESSYVHTFLQQWMDSNPFHNWLGRSALLFGKQLEILTV